MSVMLVFRFGILLVPCLDSRVETGTDVRIDTALTLFAGPMSIHLGTLVPLGTSEARPEPCPRMLAICAVLILLLYYCSVVGLLGYLILVLDTELQVLLSELLVLVHFLFDLVHGLVMLFPSLTACADWPLSDTL
jgi:hypothetical protein